MWPWSYDVQPAQLFRRPPYRVHGLQWRGWRLFWGRGGLDLYWVNVQSRITPLLQVTV